MARRAGRGRQGGKKRLTGERQRASALAGGTRDGREEVERPKSAPFSPQWTKTGRQIRINRSRVETPKGGSGFVRGNKCRGKGGGEKGVRTKMKRDRKKRKGRCRAAVNKPSSLSNVSPETEKSTRVSLTP